MLGKAMLGLHSLSGRASYRKISWSIEVTRFGFRLFQSLWNLTGCPSNARAMWLLWYPITRLRDFTRSCGKTSVRLVNRGPGVSAVTKSAVFVINGLVWAIIIVLGISKCQSNLCRIYTVYNVLAGFLYGKALPEHIVGCLPCITPSTICLIDQQNLRLDWEISSVIYLQKMDRATPVSTENGMKTPCSLIHLLPASVVSIKQW